jgi:hypothetical protein
MVANRSKLSLLFLALTLSLISCRSAKILTDVSVVRGIELKGDIRERYSIVLGVPPGDIKNEKLYKFIDQWMGVPHVTGGTDKKGIDCSAFTIELEKELYGRSLPRTAAQMAESISRKFEEDLKEGDLVFFDFNKKKFSHVGVYLLNGRFVHVSTSKGVIISNLKDPWYYKFFTRCGVIKPGFTFSNSGDE